MLLYSEIWTAGGKSVNLNNRAKGVRQNVSSVSDERGKSHDAFGLDLYYLFNSSAKYESMETSHNMQ